MNDFFTFTKGERTAIIVLAAVILLIIAANFFVAKRPSNVNFHLHNLDSIWALHENAKGERIFESPSRQVTKSPSHQVTKSLSHQVAKSVSASKSASKSASESASESESSSNLNLNSADTTELKSLPGIGSFFARNIVEYREKLGGYVEINQLLEVYAFDSARLETITPYINIDSISVGTRIATSTLRKINVNTDDFKTILRHPYIEYEDVKKLVNHRERKGFIKNWDEYLKIVGRDEIDERLRWYLEF